MGLRLCIAAICLLAAACAGSRDVAQPTGGLPPFPDAARRPSLATVTLLGREAAATSPDALAVGDDMLIPSTTGAMNWATYELTPGERPLVLEVWLRDAQSSEAWVALADFAAGSWELRGPIESHELFVLDRARHLSQSGSVHAAVIVTGQHYALVEKLENIEREPPVASFTVSNSRGAPGEVVTVDASGSISPDGSIVQYDWDFSGDGDYDNGPYFEPWVSTELPQPGAVVNWGLRVTDDSGLQAYTQVRVSSLAKILNTELTYDNALGGTQIVDGNPAVVYTVSASGRSGLYYQRALDSDGVNWGDPQQLVDGNISYMPSLDIIGGRPAVVFNKPGAFYMRALDQTGELWSEPVQAAPQGQWLLGRFSFESVNGLPAMVVAPGSNKPSFVIAEDVDGTSWKAPIEMGPTFEYYGGYGGLVLRELTGVPVWFYHGFRVGAQDPLGQTWLPPAEVHAGVYPRVIEIEGGLPAALNVNWEGAGDALVYQRSQDLSGTNWSIPLEVLRTDYIYGTALAFIHGRPWIAATGPQLRYRQAADALGSAWLAEESLEAPAIDCELLELPTGVGIMYTSTTGSQDDLWFDRLETLP